MKISTSLFKHLGIVACISAALAALVLFAPRTQKSSSRLPVCPDCNALSRDTMPAGGACRTHTARNDADARRWRVKAFLSAARYSPRHGRCRRICLFTGLYPSEHKVVNKFSTFTKTSKIFSHLKELSPIVQNRRGVEGE